MTPQQMRTDEEAEFLAKALAGRSRVLEVGCGRGHVARELARRGFAMTALDINLHDVVNAPTVRFVERDFLAYEDAPFDAILFTTSLHHIAPLSAAIERACKLLRPGGLLIADEFDVAAPDAATLHWYYDVQELLLVAERYTHDHVDEPHEDVLARWQHAHHHDTRLHTAAEMAAAIADRFRIVEASRGAYLYRYISSGVTADDRGSAIAASVLAIEKRLIDEGLIMPVGVRITAERL
jgi:SAM-dependent methyltransferase